jgi:hypothetical protein
MLHFLRKQLELLCKVAKTRFIDMKYTGLALQGYHAKEGGLARLETDWQPCIRRQNGPESDKEPCLGN